MKIFQVVRPLVATQRISGLEHKHLKVLNDGKAEFVAIDAVGCIPGDWVIAVADIGHAERFIGAGIGFEEIQLRNLMYFAYLNTVEEATQDLDVGIKIFTGLNVNHGLPVPIIIRFDYHGQVPGARERAAERCRRVSDAITSRYGELFEKGLLHIMQAVRNCNANAAIEVLSCTANPQRQAGAH